jgi:hypothetical protein
VVHLIAPPAGTPKRAKVELSGLTKVMDQVALKGNVRLARSRRIDPGFFPSSP